MRNHLLRVMQLDNDKELPNSHTEGTPLTLDEPARFVWDKTPKQSVHNSLMKKRVLNDLKSNRSLYKHVSDKEFGKKSLEAAFDQAFITLRQKFKAQSDVSVAKNYKQREDTKALRARRLSRRKIVGPGVRFRIQDIQIRKRNSITGLKPETRCQLLNMWLLMVHCSWSACLRRSPRSRQTRLENYGL